ncbi:MAG: YARHG domain-containing protein [Flavobacteriales bacterium]
MNKSVLLIIAGAILLSFISFKSPLFADEEPLPYGSADSTVKAMVKVLKKYKVPYFAKVDDQYLFYACSGKWIDTSLVHYAKGDFLMGIINDKNEIILPIEYNKIYNPDATARGYIEFEKNGKRGLVNYHNKKIIAPVFDVIFPTNKWGCIANGRIGNTLYTILDNGSHVKYSYGEDDESRDFIGYLNFEVSPNTATYLVYDLQKRESEDEYYPSAKGIVFTPSYLFDLGYKEKNCFMSFHDYYDGGTYKIEMSIKKREQVGENILAFLGEFVEHSSDGRGYILENSHLFTTDSTGKFIHKTELTEPRDGKYLYITFWDGTKVDPDDYFKTRFHHDSIFKVSYIADTIDGMKKYDQFSHYSFYKISKNGKTQKLESNRIFDCTKFIELKERDFKGVFIIPKQTNGDTNGTYTEHLDIQDLELMRNEIYADYGFKFKVEKWQKYFATKPWYQPKYDDVKRFFTPIDEANLAMILKIQEKLRTNEKAFTRPRPINYGYGDW